jgi:hypothetical protein
VSFAAISLCVASQRVFIVANVNFSLSTQSGKFWIHRRICKVLCDEKYRNGEEGARKNLAVSWTVNPSGALHLSDDILDVSSDIY